MTLLCHHSSIEVRVSKTQSEESRRVNCGQYSAYRREEVVIILVVVIII